ncbi:MAG TPA: hypothetical protein PLA68_01375 [Panacibacter sp.]|nr:hypothetical protein [Panacibacter sp.]
MQKLLLLLCFCIFFFSANAQSGDMLVLKKRNKTEQRFFGGSFISIQLKNKQWVNGYLTKIKNDTLQLLPIVEKPAVNFLGMAVTDTILLSTMKIPLQNIYAVPKEEAFTYIKNGSLLQILSGGYLLLNMINTASSKDPVFGKDNIGNIAIAAGIFSVGTVMHLTHKSTHVLGKKYYLHIVQFSKPS